MRYPLTFYVSGLPERTNGRSYGPVIFIKKGNTDEAVYLHELVHVMQWAVITAVSVALAALAWFAGYQLLALLLGSVSVGVKPMLYRIPWARMHFEAMAYKQDAKACPANIDNIAKALAENYGLNLTIDDAKKLLTF